MSTSPPSTQEAAAPQPNSSSSSTSPAGDGDGIAATAGILAAAASEAAAPGADTDSARECPFCVMMRQGGCEIAFKAFMECGEKADKGQQDMAACLPQFEALNVCMEKNKAVFDALLQEMNEEEARAKQQESGPGQSSEHQQLQPDEQQQPRKSTQAPEREQA